jgi:hypothetical protein
LTFWKSGVSAGVAGTLPDAGGGNPSTLEQIMSDPIAQAAADMAAAPSSTEPHTDAPAVAQPGESAQQSASLSSNDASATSTEAVNAAAASQPTSQPVADTTVKSSEPQGTGEELPRESHLLLLEHKLAAMHAKFKTGERIVIDEFEQILGHIKAVL